MLKLHVKKSSYILGYTANKSAVVSLHIRQVSDVRVTLRKLKNSTMLRYTAAKSALSDVIHARSAEILVLNITFTALQQNMGLRVEERAAP